MPAATRDLGCERAACKPGTCRKTIPTNSSKLTKPNGSVLPAVVPPRRPRATVRSTRPTIPDCAAATPARSIAGCATRAPSRRCEARTHPPGLGGRNSLADAPKVVVTSMERIVSRLTGNGAGKSGDMAWSNHSKDESSMSDASISVASRSNNNDSSDLHTSGALGNTSGRPILTSDGNSSRLSLGDSLANITRRLSSIGTGRSKRSSLASKRSSIDTNQDSAQERAREGGAAPGVNLADFGARASRRSFSVPELQDLRPAHDAPEKPARRHSSASQKDGEEMARLIVGFNGSGSFSSSGEGSMRGFLGWPKGSKSSGGGSGSDSDLRVSGNDSWQSLGSLDSLGLPVQREKDDRQQPRRRSSLVSVGETGPTHFEEGENDEAIQQLRRSSMDRSWKQS